MDTCFYAHTYLASGMVLEATKGHDIQCRCWWEFDKNYLMVRVSSRRFTHQMAFPGEQLLEMPLELFELRIKRMCEELLRRSLDVFTVVERDSAFIPLEGAIEM
jgi:hypothetical protein